MNYSKAGSRLLSFVRRFGQKWLKTATFPGVTRIPNTMTGWCIYSQLNLPHTLRPPSMCHTVRCAEGSNRAALVCLYQSSITVPSSLQSLVFPCETRHSEILSSINSTSVSPTGLQGLRSAVWAFHKRKNSMHKRSEDLAFYWLIRKKTTS